MMKKTLLAASLAAALALPAQAHEWPADDAGRQPEFNFEFDVDMILAQADEARAKAEEARARARSAADASRDVAAKARAEALAQATAMEEWAKNFSADLSTSMAYMFTDRAGRSRVVKGAPYSADIVTETNQTLPDGNVISHRNVNKQWRDSEGRTRQETYKADKVRSVYISDPVAGMTYTLIPGSKIAVEVPRHDLTRHMEPRVRIERGDRDRTRERGEKDKVSTETTTSSDGKRIIVRTIDRDGTPGVREEVRVQVVRVGDDSSVAIAPAPPVPPMPPVPLTPGIAPLPPMPPIPGVHTMRFESMGHLGKGDSKSLGTKDFDGVKAEGKQTTWTIPAGQIGNRNPINVTSEAWYSPDLQVTVYSRYNDPRTGESIYRLASLKRAEPSADLFKVPEGYNVKGRSKPKEEKDRSK